MRDYIEGVGEVHVEDHPTQMRKDISARGVTSWGGIVETTISVTYEILESAEALRYIASVVQRNLQEKIDEEEKLDEKEGRRAYEEACRTHGA